MDASVSLPSETWSWALSDPNWCDRLAVRGKPDPISQLPDVCAFLLAVMGECGAEVQKKKLLGRPARAMSVRRRSMEEEAVEKKQTSG